jgi:hypothetical protein
MDGLFFCRLPPPLTTFDIALPYSRAAGLRDALARSDRPALGRRIRLTNARVNSVTVMEKKRTASGHEKCIRRCRESR